MRYLCLAFVLLWPVAVAAEPGAAHRAYSRGDYAAAIREWRPLAEQGLAQAQYNLGVMYDWGRGVPVDYREAVKWYLKAAEQGHAGAQYFLGLMYDNGKGVSVDDREAMKWYRKAAEQGHAGAAKIRSILETRMASSRIARVQDLGGGNSVAHLTRAPAAAVRSGSSRSLVKEAQTLLARIGYRPGPADGLPGRRTERAVKTFQSARNMTPTGVISDQLVAVLRIAAATAAKSGRPNPSTGASR